jgi:hypothetical protein
MVPIDLTPEVSDCEVITEDVAPPTPETTPIYPAPEDIPAVTGAVGPETLPQTTSADPMIPVAGSTTQTENVSSNATRTEPVKTYPQRHRKPREFYEPVWHTEVH